MSARNVFTGMLARASIGLLALCVVGCSPPSATPPPGTVRDTGVADAGFVKQDAGAQDAGVQDTGAQDTGAPDARLVQPDGGHDAGTVESPDAASPDAASPDVDGGSPVAVGVSHVQLSSGGARIESPAHYGVIGIALPLAAGQARSASHRLRLGPVTHPLSR